MKIIISLVIISLGLSPNTGQIEIVVNDCRENGRPNFWCDIKLKSDDGKLIERTISQDDNTIKKLDPGNYELEFQSILGRTEVEKIKVKKGKKTEVEICLDKFTADIERIKQFTIIDSISIGEQYTLTYETQGCFHFEQDSLTIERTNSGFFIGHSDHCKKLTHEQVDFIRDFEIKLFNARILPDCTTTDVYGLKYKGEHGLIMSDGGCEWKGFRYLKRELNQ